jgi:bacterioferritin-associated ferredoxin
MYVCLCKGITDRQIRDAVADGAANLQQVRHRLGVARQCGKCACVAKSVIERAREGQLDYSQASFYSVL